MFGAGWALSTECSQADSSQGHLASTCGLQLSDEWPLWARAPIQQVLDGWAAHAEWSDRWRGTVTPQPVWLNARCTKVSTRHLPRLVLYCWSAPMVTGSRRLAAIHGGQQFFNSLAGRLATY